LIDEESFTCIEREDGSNATGNVLTPGLLGKIFHPFEIVYARPRNGLMGIQDTYIFRKKTEAQLRWVPTLFESAMTGVDFRAEVNFELAGERHLGVLASAAELFFPATIRLSLHRVGDPSAVAASLPVMLPDKVKWTRLDAAHALIAINDIPAWVGSAILTVEVSAERRDRAAFESQLPIGPAWPAGRGPLDNANLSLTKAVLF
jgi:hypothetical protein